MIVRLLPKNEIDKRRAEEKRALIEEGMRVAEKVDTLRETVASEEVAFDKYRTQSLKNIQAEIESLRKVKTELEQDILRHRAELKELSVPLDAEWEKVEAKALQLTDFEKSLFALEEELRLERIENGIHERIAKEREKKASNSEAVASQKLIQATKVLDDARSDATRTRNDAQVALMEAQLMEEEAKKALQDIAEKTQNLIEREEKLENDKRDVASLKRLLEDRIRRAEKKLKNG